MYICFWKLCTEKKNKTVFSKTASSNTSGSWSMKLQKAVASYVRQVERTQREEEEENKKTKGGQNSDTVTGTEAELGRGD